MEKQTNHTDNEIEPSIQEASIKPARWMSKRDFHFFISFFLPAVFEYCMGTLFGIMDTMMLGDLENSSLAISAVGSVGALVGFLDAVFTMVGIGLTVVIAQSVGEGERQYASRITAKFLPVAVGVGLVVSTVSFLCSGPMVRFVCPNTELQESATEYFRIIAIGRVFAIIRVTISHALRGIGETRLPMLYNVVGGLVNVFLNWCFITGHLGFPAMGVAGAALATITAQAISMVMAILILYHKKTLVCIKGVHPWKDNYAKVSTVLKQSLPVCAEEAFLQFGSILASSIIVTLPLVQQTGYRVACSFSGLTFAVTYGFSTALVSMAGQAFGEKNILRMRAMTRSIFLYALFTCTILMVIFLFLGERIARMYSDDLEVVRIAGKCLKVYAVCAFSLSVQRIFAAILRSMNHPKITMVASTISIFGLYLVGIYLVVKVWHGNAEQVSWLSVVDQTGRALMMGASYFVIIKKKLYQFPEKFEKTQKATREIIHNRNRIRSMNKH